MREELKANELNEVSGGETIVQSKFDRVLFTTLNQYGTLKNGCTSDQAGAFVTQLLNENPGLSEREFDELCKAQFISKGWI